MKWNYLIGYKHNLDINDRSVRMYDLYPACYFGRANFECTSSARIFEVKDFVNDLGVQLFRLKA